jgi:hypothetical protein
MSKLLSLRSIEDIKKQRYRDEGVVTVTSLEQVDNSFPKLSF